MELLLSSGGKDRRSARLYLHLADLFGYLGSTLKTSDMQEDGKKASGFRQLYQALVDHLLKGKGVSSEADRQAAFGNSGLAEPAKTLIDKVANFAHRVTDVDVESVRNSGKTEDEIFELIICGAVGQASRQYSNALSALQEVMGIEKGGPHAS